MKKLLLILLFITMILYSIIAENKNVGNNKTENLQVQQSNLKNQRIWLEDFDSLYTMIKENYPYLSVKERVHGYNWLNLKEYYRQRIINAKEPIEFLNILYDAVQALQNRHTRVFEPEWLDYYYRDSPNNFYLTDEPYKNIFTVGLKKSYENWRSFFEAIIDQRYWIQYDVLIVYDKGVYKLVDGYNGWKEKYGNESTVISVNSIPIDEAIKSCFEKTYLDWDYNRNKSFSWRIQPIMFGSNAKFEILTTSGISKIVAFQSGMEFMYNNPYHLPMDRIETKILFDNKIAYLRINDFMSDNSDEDHKELLEFYKTIKDFGFLIIDIRWNQGGSYDPWMRNVIAPLCKNQLVSKMYLAYRAGSYVNRFRENAGINKIVPKESLNNLPVEVRHADFTIYDYSQTVSPSCEVDFKGHIVILTDRFTYSATDAFALFCKETKFGKLYGIPTGGDGISDSPVFYTLPNTKICIRFTPAMGIDYTGNADEEARVQPDVGYESSLGNYNELIDFVVNQININNEK